MIAVVIPLYNKVKSIESTLQSVLKQSFQDFEVIVVDDGSTDGGAEVVRALQDTRIRLIQKENGGVSSARNVGIRAAKGEHIAFLDADDLWERDFLLEISRLIIDFPEAGILGTSYYYLSNGEKKDANKPLPKDFYGIIDNINWGFAHLYWTSALCCKKTALEQYAMFDERITHGEDIDVWWRIMLHYPAAYSNKSLAIYRLDENNRAMHKTIPLEKHLPYYMDKYVEYREKDATFRKFFDLQCLYRLYPYATVRKYRKDVKRLLKQIDFSQQKFSMRLRFIFPRLYGFYVKLKGGLCLQSDRMIE